MYLYFNLLYNHLVTAKKGDKTYLLWIEKLHQIFFMKHLTYLILNNINLNILRATPKKLV